MRGEHCIGLTSRQGMEHEHRRRHAREGLDIGQAKHWRPTRMRKSIGVAGGPSLGQTSSPQTVHAQQPTQSSEPLIAEGSGSAAAAAMRAQVGPSILLLIQVTNSSCVYDLGCKTTGQLRPQEEGTSLSEEKRPIMVHTPFNKSRGIVAHVLKYKKPCCMYYSRRGGCATTDARCSFLICPHLLPCTMIAPVVLSPGTRSPCVTSSNPAAAMPSWSEKE